MQTTQTSTGFSHPCVCALTLALQPMYSHVPATGILFSCFFFPNSVTKSLRFCFTPSFVSELWLHPGCPVLPHQVVVLTSPVASTAPRDFSGAPSSALLTVKTWELGKSCSICHLFIASENALCSSLQKQLVLGPTHFCPTSSPHQQVIAPESQAAHLTLPSGTWVKGLVFLRDVWCYGRLLRDNLLCFWF